MPMKPRNQGYGASETPSSHLWVGNLPFEVAESELMALFEKYGVIDGITCYASRSYAFIYYKTVEDAVAAKDALQGFTFNGNSIKIEFAKPAKPSKHVWVGGFSSSVTKEKLEEELSKYGEIEEFKFIRDRNTALVDFVRVEDASAAVKNLNGLQIGDDRIRVDFLRSQPARREQTDFFEMGGAQPKGVGGFDSSWNNPDMARNHPEQTYSGHKRPQPSQSGGGRRGSNPSKVLWVGYPPSIVVDEEMLHNAMILHGEIERIKCYPGRHYSFVEFRSIEEARRAKEALQGRLFNDPRIAIMFSNSSSAPGKDFGPPFSGNRGQRPDVFGNEGPFRPPSMDMFPPNHPMAQNNFPGANGMLGPGMIRPIGPRGNLDPLLPTPDLHDLGMHSANSDLPAKAGMNQRKLSPSAAGLLPAPAHPGRSGYKTSGWDVLDPNPPSREPKRSRIGGPAFHDPSLPAVEGDEFVDQPYHSRDMRASKGHVQGRGNEDYIWRGVIAKGGTPVCHARCIPMGKGVEFELPMVVDCSARTGLDMLAKHYAGAFGFDIVFFLPDSEKDFANYTEFLRYLKSRKRAGVAKLDDGTTLFLVPPSPFLTDVLEVTGPERLYGVVLKLQPTLSAAAPSSQQFHQPLPPMQQMERQLVPSTHEYVVPQQAFPGQSEYSTTAPEPAIPSNSAYPTASLLQSQPNELFSASASGPALSLTPELIASLQSLQSATQSSVAQNGYPHTSSSQLGSTNETGVFSHGWGQVSQLYDQTGQSSQLFNNAPPTNTFQTFPTNQIASSSQVPVLPENSAMQNNAYNLQDQGSVPFRPNLAHTFAALGQQLVPLTQGAQPYPGYPGMLGTPASSHSVADSQHPNNSGSYSNSFHEGNSSCLEMNLPNSSGNSGSMNSGERLQQLPSAVGLGTTEVEVDKDQRYKSTLKFAADLLKQIQQQQQQQQQQGSSNMGNQQ